MELQPGETHYGITKKELYENDIDLTVKAKSLLKILSYNIWDKTDYWEERISHVVKLIRDNNPDVCCLLEVSKECYDFLVDALEHSYLLFQVFILENETTGMVLLCNKSTVDLPEGTQPYYYDFQTDGRIVGVELEMLSTGEKFHVLSTKLDDHRDNDHIRNEQFSLVSKVIKNLKNCIVAGDFNIFKDGEDVESSILSSKLKDSWTKMGCPVRVKYTFDGKRNRITQDTTQLRATRLYYYGSHLDIKSLSLIGTSPISDQLPIAPSCHYGLLGVFQYEKMNEY